MCGIFGWDMSNPDAQLLKAHQRSALATALMLGNDDRGGQGWGYWNPNWPADTKPRKGLAHMSFHVRAEHLAKQLRLIAHTRFATVGSICEDNCHPFICGKVIGAHNGCVSNCWELDRKYRNTSVDSEHIFWHLNDEESLESVEAYGAIEFAYLDDPQDIHLAKFNGGELAVAKTKAGTIWSSSKITLDLALRMARIKYRFYTMEEDRLYYVRNGLLYETEYDLGVAPYSASYGRWNDGKWKNSSYSSAYNGNSTSNDRTESRSTSAIYDDDGYDYASNFPNIDV